MRKAPLLLLFALGACLVAGGAYGWRHWRERQRQALVRAALPPVPDLAAWPPEYAARVRAATRAAECLQQPVAALAELAYLYHANGRFREAEQLERALQAAEPGDARWTYLLTDAAEKLGDVDAQRAWLEQTVRLAPYYPPAQLRLGDLLLKLGLPDLARARYERFLALEPGEPHARLGLARIELDHGDRNGAIRDLSSLAHDHPEFPAAQNLLSEVYAAAGDPAQAEARRRLSGATGEGRRVDDPWLDRIYAWSFDPYRIELAGGADEQSRLLASSLPFYEQAARLAPGDGSVAAALGGLDLQLNRLDDAAAALERGINRTPGSAELYDLLAQVRSRQGSDANALAALQRGIRAVPASSLLHRRLGSVLEKGGRGGEAVAAYRDAVRLEPGSAEAHWSLGCCLLSLGRMDEAEASVGRALDLEPRRADALIALAQQALAEGRLVPAASCLRVVSEHAPGMPVRSLVEHGLALAQRAGDANAHRLFTALLARPLP